MTTRVTIRTLILNSLLAFAVVSCGGGGGGSVGGVGNARVTEIVPGAPPPQPNTVFVYGITDQEGGKGAAISNPTYDMKNTTMGGNRTRNTITSATYRMEGKISFGQ